MTDIFKDYYCTTYRDGHASSYFTRWYLFINRLDNNDKVTSFRIESEFPPIHALGIIIKHHAQWDTWAPLIIEYCVNELKIDNIYLDYYDGN